MDPRPNPFDTPSKPNPFESTTPATPTTPSTTPKVEGNQGYGGPDPTVSGDLPSPEPKRGWGDTLETAVFNIPSSAGKVAGGLWDAVTDPVHTVKTLASLGEGALSKLGGVSSDEDIATAKQRLEYLKTLDPNKPVMIPGLGTVTPKNVIPNLEHIANQNSTERVAARKEIEKNFDAMKDFYAERYGSMEGFKKALAEDPVGVLLDASTVLTGYGGLARGVGAVTSKVGATTVGNAVAKTGQLAGTAGQFIDPINQSLNIGKWTLGKVIPTATKEVIGTTTGAGADSFAEAFRVAKERAIDPSSVSAAEAYQRLAAAMAGTRTLEETVALANQGVHTMKSDASAAYTYAKDNPHNGWALDQTVLDFSPIRKAWADVYGTVFNKATGIPKVAEGELAKIEKVGELITKWEANPAGHTLGGLDDLKQAIRNTTHGLDETQVERVITAMANEVKGIAAKQSDVVYRGQPNNLYRESLKGYEKTMGELDEIQKSLGIGRSETSIDSAARKLTSVMRNNVNTNFGQRVKNVEKLEGAGSIDILPEIAGHALNTWAPRGIMRPLSGAGVIAGSKMILGLPFASPKLMGHAARGLGTVSGHMQPMLNDLDTILKAAQQIGAPGTGQLSNIGTGEYDYPTARARGGILRRLER